MPQEARLQFGYWHEFGHLQTLPLALAHVVWMWRRRSGGQSRELWSRLARLLAFLVVHEATWELASEGYVVAKGGREYYRLYREHRSWMPLLFWGGMAVSALLGTIFLSKGDKS